MRYNRVLDAALWLIDGFGASANRFLHDITVTADGSHAYLSNWDAGLVLLDISDLASLPSVSLPNDRLISVALPRVRDFRGVSPKGFDGRGNFTLGLKDQLLFPEIDYMKVDKARGMNVSVVTTARTDHEARKLLQLIGMPFRQN